MTDHPPDFKSLIAKVADGNALTAEESAHAFDIMMSGDATPAQIGGFLMALRVRGETVDEIVGGATTMRAKMTRISAPDNAIDIVGTGGDGTRTVNISTASAIVVAACGVPVAKHGNRALSSRTGAADVLTALGVNIDADFALLETALREAGICFMMAPRHHGAMRNVGGPRVELGTRTIFNILGPLSNPASVKRQLIGVFSRRWVRPMAETLRQLGSEHVWVVHGSDGSDELTTTGPSYVAALEDGDIREFEFSPDEIGIPRARLDDLRGDDAEANAAALAAVLAGEKGAFRDIVLYNAAVALRIAGMVADYRAGLAMAEEAIDGGAAERTLALLRDVTNREHLPTHEIDA